MDRFWKLCLTCCLVAGMAACGPKDDNNENNTNNTMTNNTTSSNNTNSNNTNNTNSNNTNNTTPDNNSNNTDNQCNAAGEDCNIGNPTNAGFLCIEGTCREECDPQADPTDCRSGALCFQNPNGAQEFYCQPSDCNGWLDTSSCADGEQCIEATNDADICFPVGNLGEGDTCESTDMNPFPCGPGTFCAFGECQPLCDGNDDCNEAGGERCILGLLGADTGICEVGCDSYSFGQCGDGEGCYPITADDGICDTTGDIAPYQECTPRATAEDEDPCGENTFCLTFQAADGGTDAVGRCLPFCNPAAASQGAANATCPGASDSAYGRFVHLTEGAGPVDIYVDGMLLVDDLAEFANSGAFAEIAAGMHTVEVVAGADPDNTNPINTFTPTVNGGAAVTWAVVPDETTVIDVVTVDVPRNIAAPTAGNATLRAAHGIPDAPAVDVVAYAAGATDLTTGGTELAVNLATGTAGGFATVPAATYDIYIFPTGAVREAANAAVSLAGVVVADQAHASAWARGTLADTDGADPGLTLVDYASAPNARTLSGFCIDLSSDGVPSPQTGACFEECGDAATYGTGACAGPSDFCQPFRGTQACWPGGPNGVGDACNPNDLNDGCGAAAFCERAGDESGVCRAYCETSGDTNPSLTCANGEVCVGAGDVGQCGVDCAPGTEFTDASCPANLQSCFPAGGTSVCSASGSSAIGDTCDPFATTCGAGDVCVNQFGTGDLSAEDPFADGSCYGGCDAFAATPGCGNGEVCMVDILDSFLGQRDLGIGFCTAPDEDLNYGDTCAAENTICGDRGWCLATQQGTNCIELCDTEDPSCSAGSCQALFQGGTLGGCL